MPLPCSIFLRRCFPTMLVKRKRRKGPGQEGLITASPFLMPSLIGLLVFSLLPLLSSAFISLTDWNGLDQLTAPGFFQEHFYRVG